MKFVKGKNDLKTWCLENKREDLLEEWNDEKSPDEVAKGSDYEANWKCKTCDREWKARVNSRTNKNSCGCRNCSTKKASRQNANNLVDFCNHYTDFKFLLEEWDYSKNTILPSDVICSSKEEIYWKCNKCGYEWKTQLCSRTGHYRGCPACRYKGKSSLSGIEPKKKDPSNAMFYEKSFMHFCHSNDRLDLLEEYDEDNEYKPEDIIFGSSKYVNWTCRECGHKWSAQLNSRTSTQAKGCPECAKRLRIITRHKDNPEMANAELFCKNHNREKIIKEWHPTKNGKLSLDKLSPASNEIVWWKCPDCGTEWEQQIKTRIFDMAAGCPVCEGRNGVSLPEKCVAFYLNKYFSIKTSYRPSWMMGKELDVFIDGINITANKKKYTSFAVEYDGEHWHTDVSKDEFKNKLCEDNNVFLIRVRESNCPAISGCKTIKVKAKKTSDLEKAISSILKKLGVSDAEINIVDDMEDIKKFWLS